MRLIAMLMFPIACCWPLVAQAPKIDRSELLGAWKLRRVDALRSDGRTFPPLGEHVTGTLAYLASGEMVVAWGREDRPAAKNPSAPTDGEYRAMVENYFSAYFGTFELDAAGGKILHHINGGLEPDASGHTVVRDVELRGDTLVLTQPPGPCSRAFAGECAEGELIRLRLTWSRSR
jgi:hypothetical protein